MNLHVVSIIAELEKSGVNYITAGNNEVKVCCPFHDDHSPSCVLNLDKHAFKCFVAGCEASGDFATLMAGLLRVDRNTIIYDWMQRYDIESVKIIDASVIETWHQAIWSADALRRELYARGLDDTDIRQYRLGFDNGRITIPIKNAYGSYVNVRKYLPGAPGKDKMRNIKGRGQQRIYPIEQLSYDTIVVCGGEIKALAAARRLNSHGIGAVSNTGGEGNWTNALSEQLRGKRVYICLDIDAAGVKAASHSALQLVSIADWIGIVNLPLDIDRYPKGDINDYVMTEGADLHSVIVNTPEWLPEYTSPVWTEDKSDPIPVVLSQSISSRYTRQRLAFTAQIAAIGKAPYVIPKKVVVHCDKGQTFCQVCPVFAAKESPEYKGVEVTVPPESDAILQMAGGNKRAIPEALREAVGVPAVCKVVSFETLTHYNAELARLNPSMEITNRDTDRTMVSAVCVDSGIALNESYEFIAKQHPHPLSQEATLVISKSTAVSDALDTYRVKRLEELAVFQPKEWTLAALSEKLSDIYTDFSANVTHIRLRESLHLVTDLAYHSPLLIRFDGRTVKGWTEALILGDSSQGKTETAINLQAHYGLGSKVECKNATVAGLLGGLQKFGEQWMVTWGVIPANDKRLVILEELKGATVHTISKLTDMRSSGIAELPKIERRRKHSRTRLLALSNARSDRTIASYGYGVEAVLELIGNPEDVRRFDIVLLISQADVDSKIINEAQRTRLNIPHVYTADLCRELVLWAWTRSPDDVSYETEAKELVLAEATRLSSKFTDHIPIFDRGSARYKLARLAASLAARTFSMHGNAELLVRKCHVEYIVRFLETTYCDTTHGYDRLAETMRRAMTMTDSNAVQTCLLAAPHPLELCESLLYSDTVDLTDLMDWCGWERFQAQVAMSLLVRKRALVRFGKSYRKNPELVELLRSMLASGISARPEFIEEKKF